MLQKPAGTAYYQAFSFANSIQVQPNSHSQALRRQAVSVRRTLGGHTVRLGLHGSDFLCDWLPVATSAVSKYHVLILLYPGLFSAAAVLLALVQPVIAVRMNGQLLKRSASGNCKCHVLAACPLFWGRPGD